MEISRLIEVSDNFCKEIKAGMDKKPTSLPFIVHKLAAKALVEDKELFQVLKIGGSILQNALVFQEKDKIIIQSLEEEHLPLFTTGKAFLALVKAHLRKNIKVLAINFAYPMAPVFTKGRLDGRLISGSKEHTFIGLVGKQVGAEVEKFIKKKFKKRIKVSVANDTICLALSGLTRFSDEEICGGVVGTGINFAFFLGKHRLVNLESAQFDKFTPKPETKEIDRFSVEPGTAIFEKETVGGYLFKHYNLIVKRTGKKVKPVVSTHALDKVARGEMNGEMKLAQKLLREAAQMVACQIAGIVKFKKRDMTFIMEGSLFWVGFKFKETVEKTVRQLVSNYQVSFKEIRDCGIVGAAKLVLV